MSTSMSENHDPHDPHPPSSSSSQAAAFLEHVTTPLNACSWESLPHPVVVPNYESCNAKYDDDDDDDDAEKMLVWPCMLGCYELDEATGQRQGHLDLYCVPVPQTKRHHDDDEEEPPALRSGVLLGTPITVLGLAAEQNSASIKTASGILDGKWYPQSIRTSSIPSSGATEEEEEEAFSSPPPLLVYATAHATGEIQLHEVVHVTSPPKDNDSGREDPHFVPPPPLQVRPIGQSVETENKALCLSLNWDLVGLYNNTDSESRQRKLISSYSDGHVAIHQVDITTTASENDTNNDLKGMGDSGGHRTTAHLEELESWPAHKIFHSPAEVWTASFTTHTDVVLTGGDEGQLKIWDLRAGTTRPMHALKDLFQAGVTILSPHPRRDHIVACGSYDESMAILDLRNLRSSNGSSSSSIQPLCHSEPLGGGLWRMKWHPIHDDRLLLGAMHGGCRIVSLRGLFEDVSSVGYNYGEKRAVVVQVQQSFTNHKSMAYGTDWLVYQPPGQSNLVEAAASCSFYDRALYLWNVNRRY